MQHINRYFDFFELPNEIKTIIFQKNRDVVLHRRRTRWMYYELSTIHFFQPIPREDVSLYEFPNCGPFLCPSDLFERQDSDDLDLCDLEENIFSRLIVQGHCTMNFRFTLIPDTRD